MNRDHPLDNPVWHSLSQAHSQFAIDKGAIKFYHPDYCPFAGFVSNENLDVHLVNYSELISNFFVVGEKPMLPNSLTLKRELICLQMITENRIELEPKEQIHLLNNHHEDALFELVNLVQPGYFKRKTFQLGNYVGIFKDDQLVSVAGERMHLNGFVEVSAIVTHPDYTGKGLAKQLIAHTVNAMLDRNCMPFLHVVESNIGAIYLYKQLGFATRRTMSFWNIIK